MNFQTVGSGEHLVAADARKDVSKIPSLRLPHHRVMMMEVRVEGIARLRSEAGDWLLGPVRRRQPRCTPSLESRADLALVRREPVL